MSDYSKTYILAADSFNDIIGGRAQQLCDDRELVDIWPHMSGAVGRNRRFSRSLPGNNGFPSSISAKMQPVLQISTATSYFCHVSMISGAR